MHSSPSFTHLQLVLQVQLKRVLHDLLVSSSIVHRGTRSSGEFRFQPQSVNGGRVGWRIRAWDHINPACSKDLWICWKRASCVGGSLPSKRTPYLNKTTLALYTRDYPQLLLYIHTNHLFSLSMWIESPVNRWGLDWIAIICETRN